ncbi:hypothetical protein CEXT_570941 [Caerostris extrusa]|uniref:Uncharacterized protein n=1 Tax=Caerostris extrusa TaxID=172846 RepID=A0AAV4RCV2_CAEEX|nr:hypothetical protein CEXT_570941 [Caerostris extrusa]
MHIHRLPPNARGDLLAEAHNLRKVVSRGLLGFILLKPPVSNGSCALSIQIFGCQTGKWFENPFKSQSGKCFIPDDEKNGKSERSLSEHLFIHFFGRDVIDVVVTCKTLKKGIP